MLSPRAIAVKGLGFGAILTAFLGLFPITIPPAPPIGGGTLGYGGGPSQKDKPIIKVARVDDEDAILIMIGVI